MDRFKVIASVYLILIENDKILLQRRCNTGFEDGNYGLPAGHLEDNETVTQALVREIKEEIDLDLKDKDVKLVHTMHRKSNDIRIDLFFTTKAYRGEVKNAEPNKCDDLQWFPVDNLPSNTIPYIRAVIKSYLSKNIYSEIGWEI